MNMKLKLSALPFLLLSAGSVIAQTASPADSDAIATATPAELNGKAAGAIFGGICLMWLVFLAIYLAGAIWVTKDARRRNSPNATLVTVLTWLPPTWLIGIIVHLVTRPKDGAGTNYNPPPTSPTV